MKNIPAIIFSFELSDGKIIDVKEHKTLHDASCYIGYPVEERPENGIRYFTQWITKTNSNINSNAKWVVDFSYFLDSDHKLPEGAKNKNVFTALKKLKRFKNLKILLGD